MQHTIENAFMLSQDGLTKVIGFIHSLSSNEL